MLLHGRDETALVYLSGTDPLGRGGGWLSRCCSHTSNLGKVINSSKPLHLLVGPINVLISEVIQRIQYL